MAATPWTNGTRVARFSRGVVRVGSSASGRRGRRRLSDELLVLSVAPRSRKSQHAPRKRLKLSRAQLDCEQPALCILESKDRLACLAVLTYGHNTLYLDQTALYIPILRLQA